MSYFDDAQREHDQESIFRRWIQVRIETLHQRVNAADVLSRYGVKLRYDGSRSEQMMCPFHGNTNTPAARYHPADNKSHDHVWCFVCNKNWDAIELYREFENLGTEAKFSAVLRGLERAYGITPPETPPVVADEPDDHEQAEIEGLLDTCDFRLKKGRNAFDMRGYLTLGSIIDRLRWQFDNGKTLVPSARLTIEKVLAKIGEKVRACPGD
jgi:hypothetical protein